MHLNSQKMLEIEDGGAEIYENGDREEGWCFHRFMLLWIGDSLLIVAYSIPELRGKYL